MASENPQPNGNAVANGVAEVKDRIAHPEREENVFLFIPNLIGRLSAFCERDSRREHLC